MTRIAIVAASARLRASLAAALRASPEFEVVGVGASDTNVPSSVDVVLVARAGEDSGLRTQPTRGDAIVGTILTNREREILALLADGLANKQIAARLGISKNTVKTHIELLFDKLAVSTRAEAVATGVRRGLLLL
ncbi:MAG TPA: LuxR C-terminal-related transcriptional regulator [Gemmatimonadaceae bacterium]|nr:LuxR C-terminal-related transcriptional regulator [Gemmatimonadaceae bacterium]